MSDAFDHEKQEEPLDPAVERVQTKLRRLLFGSSLIMLLGFAAVVIVIVYRLNRDSAEDTAYQVPSLVTNANLRKAAYPLPQGAIIIATTLDGENMAVTYDVPNKSGGVLLIDLKSWQVHSVLTLDKKQN